jgi:mitogen-activated protein kinase kinase 1
LTIIQPERFEGNEYLPNSDLWSVGLTILECAIGYFPYNKDEQKLQYWNFLNIIKEGPVPRVPDSFSPAFKGFIEQW